MNGFCCSVNLHGWYFYLQVVGTSKDYMLLSKVFVVTVGGDPKTLCKITLTPLHSPLLPLFPFTPLHFRRWWGPKNMVRYNYLCPSFTPFAPFHPFVQFNPLCPLHPSFAPLHSFYFKSWLEPSGALSASVGLVRQGQPQEPWSASVEKGSEGGEQATWWNFHCLIFVQVSQFDSTQTDHLWIFGNLIMSFP